MRIGIDARLGGAKHAGIGRYIEELLRGVTSEANEHTWVIFAESRKQYPWLFQSLAGKKGRVELRIAPIRHYTLREQLFLPVLFRLARLDVLHVPHFNVPLLYRGKLVVTIHDLLWHEIQDHRATTLPPWLHALKYRGYRLVAERAIRSASIVIVPSNVVKEKIISLIPKARVKVVYEGVTAVVPAKKWPFGIIQKPALVYVGSLYPHKNVEIILKALRLLPNVTLYICSSRNIFTQQFIETAQILGVHRQVKLLGYVSDAEVAFLEKQSLALVQPSTSEGFGLTGLEALALGVPVIASDIPVFREIYGHLACYANTLDEQSVAKAVLSVETHESVWRHKLEKAGPLLRERFNWQAMAKKTLEIYEHV